MSAKIARLNAKERIISAEIQLAKAEIQLAELQIEKARVIAARSKSRSAHSPESSLHSSKIYSAKRDVSGWTYQQMRVAINSSTDIILLEACKEEFHRRLKVYNNWKKRNAARTGENQHRATKQLLQEESAMSAKMMELNAKERIVSAKAEIELAKAEIRLAQLQIQKARTIAARSKSRSPISSQSSPHNSNSHEYSLSIPEDISKKTAHEPAAKSLPTTQARTSKENRDQVNRVQRYFRIPFIRSADQSVSRSNVKRGWWCAHFDGDYVARQMELHPDKPPLLLVAGKDDTEICELPLKETGLTRKKAAEILPLEFEQVWMANGGREYLLKAISSGQAKPTYATAMLPRDAQSASVKT